MTNRSCNAREATVKGHGAAIEDKELVSRLRKRRRQKLEILKAGRKGRGSRLGRQRRSRGGGNSAEKTGGDIFCPHRARGKGKRGRFLEKERIGEKQQNAPNRGTTARTGAEGDDGRNDYRIILYIHVIPLFVKQRGEGGLKVGS